VVSRDFELPPPLAGYRRDDVEAAVKKTSSSTSIRHSNGICNVQCSFSRGLDYCLLEIPDCFTVLSVTEVF
jgi:hypothetical protein